MEPCDLLLSRLTRLFVLTFHNILLVSTLKLATPYYLKCYGNLVTSICCEETRSSVRMAPEDQTIERKTEEVVYSGLGVMQSLWVSKKGLGDK